jgi:hypothetical protein
MPAPSPLAPFVEPLERLGFPYCITGSVAASIYGEPRLTADIDVIVLLRVEDIAALRAAFPEDSSSVPLAATAVDRPFVEAQVTRLGLQAQWRACQPG